MAAGKKLRVGDGSKSFAREVGIVVLGVVIALGLGEIVDSVNWANRREQAQAALASELSAAVNSSVERQVISGCLERRLAQVAMVLDKAATTGRLPAIRDFPRPPMRPWRSTVWETAVASQAASRFPIKTLNRLGRAYQTIDQVRAWNVEEKAAWTSLTLLEGAERPFNPQLEIYLRDAHAKAKYYARLIPLSVGFLVRDVRRAGFKIEVEPLQGPHEVCSPLTIAAA